MQSFEQKFEHLLTAIESDMHDPFSLHRDAMVAGRWVALDASFGLNAERRIFGMVPTGNMSHCQETCLFLPFETLTLSTLEEQQRYAARVVEETVQPDATHEFSMVSLVLATNAMDKALQKPIKKYTHDIRYALPQRGWASVRLAIIDLSDGKIYANLAGSSLRDRLLPSVKKCMLAIHAQ